MFVVQILCSLPHNDLQYVTVILTTRIVRLFLKKVLIVTRAEDIAVLRKIENVFVAMGLSCSPQKGKELSCSPQNSHVDQNKRRFRITTFLKSFT